MFGALLRRASRGLDRQAARHLAVPAAAAAAGGVLARRAALLFPVAGLGAYAVVGDDPKRVAYTVAATPLRFGRDAYTATAILLDYKWSLRGLDGATRDAARAACHERGADRLLQLCRANGGLYIKLGQHVAMLDHLLPAQYVLLMREHLLDRCPVSSWESVRRTLEEDLGCSVESCFAQINPVPVASASLAQVHVATDAASGRRLAVKVQHRGLRETSAADLAVIEALVRAVRALSPGTDFMWLVEEAKDNLPRELDFLVEAANSERCAANLASKASRVRGRVVVPRVDHARSSHRVLVMEFIDGAKVTDLEGLQRLKAPPAAVARAIAETFAEMVFRFGDVHADPHAANMLVRAAPPGAGVKWQLVLLDHGLYRRLDDDFRTEYASLWRSLIFADIPGIERSAKAMNAGDAVPLFAGMLTQRPWEAVSAARGGGDRLRLSYTPGEREQRLRYAEQYAEEIGALLARIPSELLLLLKTNDCLRAVDAELGAGVTNYVVTARECARALAERRRRERPGWHGAAAEVWEAARLEARLTALRLAAWLAPVPVLSASPAAAGA